jgi:hypothetical protein
MIIATSERGPAQPAALQLNFSNLRVIKQASSAAGSNLGVCTLPLWAHAWAQVLISAKSLLDNHQSLDHHQRAGQLHASAKVHHLQCSCLIYQSAPRKDYSPRVAGCSLVIAD